MSTEARNRDIDCPHTYSAGTHRRDIAGAPLAQVPGSKPKVLSPAPQYPSVASKAAIVSGLISIQPGQPALVGPSSHDRSNSWPTLSDLLREQTLFLALCFVVGGWWLILEPCQGPPSRLIRATQRVSEIQPNQLSADSRAIARYTRGKIAQVDYVCIS